MTIGPLMPRSHRARPADWVGSRKAEVSGSAGMYLDRHGVRKRNGFRVRHRLTHSAPGSRESTCTAACSATFAKDDLDQCERRPLDWPVPIVDPTHPWRAVDLDRAG